MTREACGHAVSLFNEEIQCENTGGNKFIKQLGERERSRGRERLAVATLHLRRATESP